MTKIADFQNEPASKRVKKDLSEFAHNLVKLEEKVAKSSAGDQVWERAAVPDLTNKPIHFQQIDADESSRLGEPIVRMFGVTKDGNSVLCDITGFHHYLYVKAPVGFRQSDVGEFTAYLKNQCDFLDVTRVDLVLKQNLWGYVSDEKQPFLRIVTRNPRTIPRIRSHIESSPVQFRGMTFDTTTFDNIAYFMRCMIDCHIQGMSWLTLPANKYKFTPEEQRESRAQIEVSIPYTDLIAHQPEDEWLDSAPLRILSFDIECAGRKGIFPQADVDPVIQIANMVQVHGASHPFIRNVFTLGTCSSISGSQVLSFSTERELLLAWCDFVKKVDPDVVIGYNIGNFDLPYLIDRAAALKLDTFPYFGRLRHVKQTVNVARFSSKAFGSSENKVVNMEGRLQIDLLQYIRREYKLRSYTLNAVSAHFLNEQKEDVHHSMITELQNGTKDSRRRLAVYCLKDAYLPLRLINKLMALVNMTEMARVTGVPLSYLLSRGQQVKVISQLFRKALEVDMVVPNLHQEGSSDEQYEGATVIEPVRGYYNVPVATLDFSSLYPSIMMAHNLCYTTLLDKATVEKLKLIKEEDYIVTPNGDMFVTEKRRRGILPIILEDLLSARKRAKADLKKETNPFKRAVLDGRQLALKVSANSVYGFTGATIGKLPCLAISSSVTAFGREMIEATKELVEKHYVRANGYDHDSKVIYGDTDSVMVKFGTDNLERAMELGREAADLVSQTFKDPIKLEFEKVYFPYLLINKKRYAGLYWTRPDQFDKMDTKGIETVRRDNCRLVQNVIETVLRKILIDRDIDGAQTYVKNIITNLLRNNVDLSLLIITKQLSRSDYANKQPHVELAERMRERDPGSAPTLGDRVPYVIISGGERSYEKSEDPVYVLENNLQIDTEYYLENQLKNPLLRIFEPILHSKAHSLLTGDHTRVMKKLVPSTGPLASLFVRGQTCMGCKRPLKGARASMAVCSNCTSQLDELYMRTRDTANSLQDKFSRLWTQCQGCQEGHLEDVICASQDCPIFFMRRKVQKDMCDIHKELRRFDVTDW